MTVDARRTDLPAKRRSARVSPSRRVPQDGEPGGVNVADEHPVSPSGWVLGKWRGLLVLTALCVGLKSLIFEPINLWPVAFVCMVPWLLVIGGSAYAPRAYLLSFLLGLTYFLLNMRWLIPATGFGYVALSVYLALFFPLIACPLRHVIRRRWPLAIAFPLIWTGNEICRAVFFSGFPWFFLSHAFADVLSLIQVSDLVGAYGVSFVVAAVNGAVADVVFERLRCGGSARIAEAVRARGGPAAFATVLVIAAFVYGQVQLSRNTMLPGPKVAVIQGDFLSLVEGDDVDDITKRRIYFEMMQAASAEKPDLYLLPETPWIMYLNAESRDFFRLARESFSMFREFANSHGAYVVTGSASLERKPADLIAKERRFNSATVFAPNGSEPGRYDKVHVVPFGEAVPFRFGRMRFLYFWLNSIMPFSGPDGKREYSLFPGAEFRVFEMTTAGAGNRRFRFGVPICYEDVMPYVSRRFVSDGKPAKQADFLLNISNDGWFGRGIQQPQHLAICVFRAVENRVGIARAVNTGISGFINPDGRRHDLVEGDPQKRWEGACGYAVATVGVDSRYSLYSRYGDWFAWSCAAAWGLLFLDYWIARIRGRGEPTPDA